MTGGLIAIGVAAAIASNFDRIVAKVHKSDLFAWALTLSSLALIILVAHLYLTGGR